MSTALHLYIANKNYSSWSLRPWILMRQLGIPFTETLLPFSENPAAAGRSFRAQSPTGLLPCLHAGDVVVWDSLAIAEFLAEQHPGVWPVDAVARAWARSAAAEMHSGFTALRRQCSMTIGQRVRLQRLDAALEQDLHRLRELWTEGLRRFGGPFLAGPQFTAVDAFFTPVAFRIQTYDLDVGEVSLVYAQRLRALPASEEWTAAALKEPWRERSHEDAIAQAGEVWKDLRAS